MPVQAAVLSTEDNDRMRQADAQLRVIDGGGHGLSFEDAKAHIIGYYEVVGEMHERYDLDPEQHYEFDLARGIIFESFD